MGNIYADDVIAVVNKKCECGSTEFIATYERTFEVDIENEGAGETTDDDNLKSVVCKKCGMEYLE